MEIPYALQPIYTQKFFKSQYNTLTVMSMKGRPCIVFRICWSGKTILAGVMRRLEAYMVGKLVTQTL